MTTAAREAFEKWAHETLGCDYHELRRCPDKPNMYEDTHVEVASLAWQAALAYVAREVKRLQPAPASEYAGRILLEEADVLALLKAAMGRE